MRRALLRHRRDMIAPFVMVLLALGVVIYILAHQPAFRAPSFLQKDEDKNMFAFKAYFTSAPAIVAGQGQTVNIAGVSVGDVRGVETKHGQALLTFEIRRKYVPIYKDATILLRPRTPLKDMYIALDPGHRSAGKLSRNGTLPVSQTEPDVNYEEFLDNLDGDTRDYLRLLLSAASQGLRDPSDAPAGDGRPSTRSVDDLRYIYKRFDPLARHGKELFGALAHRRKALASAVHDFTKVAVTLGGVNRELSSLIDVSNRNFQAFAEQDGNLRQTLSELPSALQATDTALGHVTPFANQLATTMTRLRPFARALGPSQLAVRPFVTKTTPIIKNELRPFARNVQPAFEALTPATQKLAKVLPPLDRTVQFFNRFFNALAYNPKGAEEGFLFWGSWFAHDGPSVLTGQDAHGATARAVVLATCAQLDALHQVELGNPSLGPIIRLLGLADRTKVCPQIPGVS